MVDFDKCIREFVPINDSWLELEICFEKVFSSSRPEMYYDAIFNLFERFPDDDGCGIFWSALHGMEKYGNYEPKLLMYFRRQPGLMTRTMLQRICNSGQAQINGIDIDKLIAVR